jgi:transposase
MQTTTTVGLHIAKSVFQVHGVDAKGNVVVRRQLKRRCVLAFFQKLPPCMVGIEACASSHYWSRELQAFGHTVRLMPPAYVKPYVKRHKNDAADAEAGGRLTECIKAHFQDFTEPCKAALVRVTPMRESCGADIQEQCPAIKPGAGRILLCVRRRFAPLCEAKMRSVVQQSTN